MTYTRPPAHRCGPCHFDSRHPAPATLTAVPKTPATNRGTDPFV